MQYFKMLYWEDGFGMSSMEVMGCYQLSTKALETNWPLGGGAEHREHPCMLSKAIRFFPPPP